MHASQFLEKKKCFFILDSQNLCIFAPAMQKQEHWAKTRTLGYGVMVTLQILVLSFLVRVQVAQQENPAVWYNCSAGFFIPPFEWKGMACKHWQAPVSR